jgi:transposase
MRTLRNDQWQKIRDVLEQCPDVYLGTEANSRRFIEAVLWINRTGASWRDLPPRYGNWNSSYKRFARWCDQGIWGQMLAHFADDPDMEHLILDSTVVRAYPCAAGARKKPAARMHRRSDAVAGASAPKSTSVWMGWATRCG